MKRDIILLNIILVTIMFCSCQKDNFYDSISEEGTKVSFGIQFSDDAYDSDVELNPMSRAEVVPEYNDFCYNSCYFIILKKLPDDMSVSGKEKYCVLKALDNFTDIETSNNAHELCKRTDINFIIPPQVLQPGDYKFICIVNGNYNRLALYEGNIIDDATSILQNNFYQSTRELYIGFKDLKVAKKNSLEDDAALNEKININLDRYCTPLNLIIDTTEDNFGVQQAYSVYYNVSYTAPSGVNYNGELLNVDDKTFEVDDVYFSNSFKNLKLSKYSMQDQYLNAFIVTKGAVNGIDVHLSVEGISFTEGADTYFSYKGNVSTDFKVYDSKPAHVLFEIKKDGNKPQTNKGNLKTDRDELSKQWETEFPKDKTFIPLNYQAYNEYIIK